MHPDPIRLALVYGSAREGRFCDRIVDWLKGELEGSGGLELLLIDPARLSEEAEIRKYVERSEAYIVVTPEYNHSYTAALKALIDSANREWHAKPVAFVSYGGVSGGLRAVEHLRGVFAELHAVSVRETVSFINAWEQFDSNGRLIAPERAVRALAGLLTRLRWWALALREARRAVPFSKAA